METHNLTLHGTGAVKIVESQFVMRKSWKEEKVGATLELQVNLLENQSASPSAWR